LRRGLCRRLRPGLRGRSRCGSLCRLRRSTRAEGRGGENSCVRDE
jgi:hypothetical protein